MAAGVFFNVKNFIDALKIFFVISGAVLGAGFLSGGELVAFFGTRNVICLALAGAVFFLGFAFCRVEKDRFTNTAFMLADCIFSASMLSGLDEMAGLFGALKGIPVVSVLSLLLFHFFISKDIKKVEKVNCILIPAAIVVVFCAAIDAPAHAPMSVTCRAGAKDLLNAVLYACMNVFAALPAVGIAATGKKNGVKVAAAICFSVFFVLFAFIILRAALNTAFPLLDMSYGTALYPFIVGAVFIGSFTSLVCYLYPLKNFLEEKTENKNSRAVYCFLLYTGLFLLSRLGLNAIIRYLYPLIGGLGAFSVCKNLFGIKRTAKGDTTIKRSALCQERKRIKSKNLPKKNTAII